MRGVHAPTLGVHPSIGRVWCLVCGGGRRGFVLMGAGLEVGLSRRETCLHRTCVSVVAALVLMGCTTSRTSTPGAPTVDGSPNSRLLRASPPETTDSSRSHAGCRRVKATPQLRRC